MSMEQVIAGLEGLDLEGVCDVAVACIAAIGKQDDADAARGVFESSLRTHAGSDKSRQGDLSAGGSTIYYAINDLDDGDFDFDPVEDDESESDEA